MPFSAHLKHSTVIERISKQGLSVDSAEDQKKFLLQLCEIAKKFSFAPYSNFNVGAAAWLANGDIVLGANLELSHDLVNAIHAEQSLIVQAINLEQEIIKIAVNYAPCGFCRQSIMELSNGPEIEIFFGKEVASLAELLPLPFSPKDLDQTDLPPHYPKWQLKPSSVWNNVPECCKELLQNNLTSSYAPRTKSPAAIVLETADGQLFCGKYFENVAFNPTISAIRFALVMMAHYRPGVPKKDEEYITNVWLAQSDTSSVDHLSQTQQVLDCFGYNKPINIINSTIDLDVNLKSSLPHTVCL